MKQVVDIVGFEFGVRLCGILGAAARWWLDELIQSVPSSIRLKLSQQRQRRYVRIRDEQIEIADDNRIGEWKLPSSSEDGKQSISEPVTLLLPATTVLRRVIELPIAASATLHETTSFQIGRVTPFKPDEVYYAARILQKDRLKKIIRTEIAVTPREAANSSLECVISRGLQPAAIFVEGDTSQPAFDFLPQIGATIAPQAKSWTRWAIVTGVCLLIWAPFLATFRLHLIAERSRSQVALAAKIAAKASDYQTRLDSLISLESFLPDQLRGPHSLEILDGLSRQVPDTSWVFRLEIRANSAVISGLSSDLPALLQQLARSPFSAPELTSPVVQGLAGGPARFELRVKYGLDQ